MLDLTKNSNGNYVVQSLIKNGSQDDKKFVIEQFKTEILTLSTDKYASNVVESCLRNSSNSQKRELVQEFLRNDVDGFCPIQKMIKDKFGNYVI